ncbi:hypothetical protein F8388_005049 [Cannabis sativa]|uniref:methylmalonate-semialdehyde dehydrogenase (CoA acylating) n=1 Tax=Cannabis sativa TaxID=3483 RepID=A0A7J6E4W5_CANSA|nr:hypothetical protein F8388_005049 [Cannabis sativa]
MLVTLVGTRNSNQDEACVPKPVVGLGCPILFLNLQVFTQLSRSRCSFLEKSFNSWRPNRSVPVNTSTSNTERTTMQNNQPLKVPNFVGGKFVDSHASSVVDVINPATQEVVSQVPISTYEEFKAAVSSAKQAFPLWKNTPITTRQRIMFKLQELISRDIDKLSMNITMEQGKTSKDAHGDVLRGLEVVEHACGMGNLQMGEFVPNSSNGIDTYCIREPLGVCAGICPFNFPAMTPLWMFPIAVTCGNTFVLKPCENNPGASLMLASLATEAGLPDGVLNVVHGAHDIVNYICDDDDIKAISFVGSNTAGMHVYARAASRGKRVQSNIGGKNLAIIMPDASVDTTLNALVAAGFGDAGVATSTAIFVRGSIPWEKELVDRAKALKVNVGTDPNADLGPVITKEAKDRICRLVHNSLESGARLLLDGRKVVVPGYENGSFIGPTILSDITTNMDCYKEEMFGPILLCMQVDSLEEAIMIVNRSRYVNGASVFTTSGISARKFQNEVDVGLVGINVSVPVPLPFSSFSGSKASFSGKSGVQFYTQIKTVAQQWKDLSSLVLPVAVPPPSEKDMTRRAACSALPSSTDRDSASQRESPSLHSESETDSPSHGVSLPITSSEVDLPNPGVSSVSSTADRDLPSRGVYLPPASERELSNGEMSLALPPTERDLPNQGVSITSTQLSERMYMPQASRWDEASHPTSQRNDALPPSSERIHTATSQRSDNTSLASQRTDINMALTPERVYIPVSHDTVGSMSHRSDNVAASSHQADANVHPSSERVYMLTTSHLGDSTSQTFQRSDGMFTTSGRLYMPATSHRSDHIGSSTQRNNIALHSERIYMSSASQRNDNLAAVSQSSDSMPSTSERMYLSSIAQRNTAMPPTSERLYIHAKDSQSLPSSQRTDSRAIYILGNQEPVNKMILVVSKKLLIFVESSWMFLLGVGYLLGTTHNSPEAKKFTRGALLTTYPSKLRVWNSSELSIPERRTHFHNNSYSENNHGEVSLVGSKIPLPAHVKSITSTSNPFVKHCLKLRLSSSYRHTYGSVLVVGATPIREIYKFQESLHEKTVRMDCLLVLDKAEIPEEIGGFSARTVRVSNAVMKKLSGLQSTESIEVIGLMSIPTSFFNLDDQQQEAGCERWFPVAHRILVLDGIQDPGNLGTLVRSAMAFKWGGIFLLPGCCDPFNDKAIRASRGASFQLPIVCGSWFHLQNLISEFQAKMLAAHPDSRDETKPVFQLSQKLADSYSNLPLCLVLGSEGGGLSEKSRHECELVSIPMAGQFESLNVSVAGGILLYMLQPRN